MIIAKWQYQHATPYLCMGIIFEDATIRQGPKTIRIFNVASWLSLDGRLADSNPIPHARNQ